MRKSWPLGIVILIASVSVAAQEAREEPASAPPPADSQSTNSVAKAEAPEVPEEPDPGEEVVCRTEKVTGSLTRRQRTCLTRNEWEQVESRTRDELNRFGRNAAGGVSCRQDQMGGC